MNSLRKNVAGILISGFIWPSIHYLIGVMRFGAANPSTSFLQALLDFGLFGLVAGWIYYFFRDRAFSDRQKSLSAWGYLAAAPFAFLGSLAGGLFLPPIIGTVVMGGIPLLIGSWLGSIVGGMSGAG